MIRVGKFVNITLRLLGSYQVSGVLGSDIICRQTLSWVKSVEKYDLYVQVQRCVFMVAIAILL